MIVIAIATVTFSITTWALAILGIWFGCLHRCEHLPVWDTVVNLIIHNYILFTYRLLRHPNIESLIGVSLDETPIYLITEYMAKGVLMDYIRAHGRAVISKSSLYEFAKHICKAMVYLESKNLVHR